MKIVSKEEFKRLIGNSMPPQRNMNTFNGDRFDCACGSTHAFGIDNIKVIEEGMNGKFVIVCPNNKDILSLIQTKMKWGILYQGLELIAGCKE